MIPPRPQFFRVVTQASLGVVALLMAASAVSVQASSEENIRGLGITDLSCSCGKNETQVLPLQVRKRKASECTEVPFRGIRRKYLSTNPFHLKVRRLKSSSQIYINWNLKYIPKAKRVKVTEFYLFLAKTQRKRNREKRQRGACYRISLPKVSSSPTTCQRRITCLADVRKRRPPRMTVNLLYRFAAKRSKNGGRKKRGQTQKYFKLKASVRKKRHRIPTAGIPTNTMRTDNVFGITSVSRGMSECKDWDPQIIAEGRENGTLHVEFFPLNPFADRIEVAVHERFSTKYKTYKNLSKNENQCEFHELEPGNYSVTIRPFGDKCYGVLPTRSNLIMVDGRPVCSDWRPQIQMRETVERPPRLVVLYDFPSNLQAEHVEVLLERDGMVIDRKVRDKRERNATFDIKPERRTYRAMVRALGCRDCMDYMLHGDRCELSFFKSDTLHFGANIGAIGISSGGSSNSKDCGRENCSLSINDRAANTNSSHDGNIDHPNDGNKSPVGFTRGRLSRHQEPIHNNLASHEHIQRRPHARSKDRHRGSGYYAASRPGYADELCSDCCRRCACGSLDI